LGTYLIGWGGASIATALAPQTQTAYGMQAGFSVMCVSNPCGPDSDCDGCPDVNEISATHLTGGDRDRYCPWDFFDVPTPPLSIAAPNGQRNHVASVADVIAILSYIGTSSGAPANSQGFWYDTDLNANGVPDGGEYDRTAGAIVGKPWRSGPPNGSVTIADALVELNQVGDNCANPP
jgi:hypothetical protein